MEQEPQTHRFLYCNTTGRRLILAGSTVDPPPGRVHSGLSVRRRPAGLNVGTVVSPHDQSVIHFSDGGGGGVRDAAQAPPALNAGSARSRRWTSDDDRGGGAVQRQ